MPAVENNGPTLEPHQDGTWWFNRWGSSRLLAGIADRRAHASTLLGRCGARVMTAEAEQVHGSSIAIMGRVRESGDVVPGCDALLTDTAGLALLIRTADCVPIFIADPARGVIGIAHAGWRGLAARLLNRLVAALHHAYQSRAEGLHVAIGPAIRGCCYEVGPEFEARFGRFVQPRAGRRTCDLIGIAIDQLQGSGVPADRIIDCGRCTVCEPQYWFSVRREGDATGRLLSLIMLKP